MPQNLEGNIAKYNLLKIFTKRVYLPLIAIFLVTIGHVTLIQLGLIASITGIIQIILEIPTGYIADKWGHKSALAFGMTISAFSVLPYIFMPNFLGGLLAAVLYFSGTSFSSGTTQAFMHETLLALGRESEYSKIMGRAQSYGLLGNVILISLIPLTYQIDPRLPFVIGFFCLLAACIITISFVNPEVKISLEKKRLDIFKILKESLPKGQLVKLLLVFVIFGITSAAFDQASMYRELVFKNFGIPTQYFGFILAAGSLLAAVVGRNIHYLERFSANKFYLFDILYICIGFILVGFTRNPLLVVMAFIFFPAYDRTRNIIFESRLLEEFPNSKHKATLVSIMNFFPLIGDVGAPLLLGYLVTATSLLTGHLLFGIILATILIPVLFIHNFVKK